MRVQRGGKVVGNCLENGDKGSKKWNENHRGYMASKGQGK